MQEKISVIIPTFNRRDTLKRALCSIFDQTRPANEVVVVDDGSADGTDELICKYFPDVRYFYQENKGVSAARNLGLKKVSGNWIAFLDSDDEWLPKKLELQIKIVREHPEHRFVHTDEIWIRNGQRVNQMKKHTKYGGNIFEKCLARCIVSPSSALIHNSVFHELGNFDEKLPACEDYDLWLRICARYRVLYLEQALIIKYGGHDDQLSRKFWGMDRFRIQSLNKLLSSNLLDQEQEAAVIDTLNYKTRILIDGARKRNKMDDVLFYEQILNANNATKDRPENARY
ncbi:MAG: glycosyltransferase [Gammaproteobacteria bacterium]|nr:MAG: glycosyltransferase [Gammaproteobacteria bacterium]